MSRYGQDGPCTLLEAQDDDDQRVHYQPAPCIVVGTIDGVEVHVTPAPVVQHDDATDGEGA